MAEKHGDKNRDGVHTIGALTSEVSATFTREANATQYAAGDVISDKASGPSAIEFADVVTKAGKSGVIAGARLTLGENQTTKPDCELIVFNAEPTAMEDNAAFDPTDAEVNTIVGTFPFDTWYVGKATAGAAGNCWSHSSKGSYPFVLSDGTSLWGILVERGTYTPVASTPIVLTLIVYRD